MELLIILVLIIVIFNAFGGAVQRNKGRPPRAVPGDSRYFREPFKVPVMEPRAQNRRIPPHEPETAGRKPEEPLSMASLPGERAAGDIGAGLPPRQRPKEEAVRTGAVAGSFVDILRQQDRLVAAFIFHEILEPPPARRRR